MRSCTPLDLRGPYPKSHCGVSGVMSILTAEARSDAACAGSTARIAEKMQADRVQAMLVTGKRFESITVARAVQIRPERERPGGLSHSRARRPVPLKSQEACPTQEPGGLSHSRARRPVPLNSM